MKRFFHIPKTGVLLLAGLLTLNVSCDSFLDVNDDPNSPPHVTSNLQLSAVLGYFSFRIVGNYPTRVASQWMQHISFNGSDLMENNYHQTEADVNNLWEFYAYPSVMRNAREMINDAVEEGNHKHAGIGKIVTAWTLSVVTDVWNEVPWSEAFQAEAGNFAPAYDTQEQIYQAIFTLLDEAIADLDKDGPNPGNFDLLYKGDIAKWKRMAHTLKARYHLRLSRAPGNNAAERANQALAALENGFAGNADDANFQYFSDQGAENPWFQWAIDGKWSTAYRLGASYVDLLKSLDDPRLPVQARPAASDGEFRGHRNAGAPVVANTLSQIGTMYSDANAPLTWISHAEARFIEAEARFITSGAAAAQGPYENAVRASLSKHGITGAAADDYVASLPPLTAENALEQIITQKYIANFLQFETYNDWRRTGYPQLEIAENAVIDEIPRRFPYPVSEWQNNGATVAQTGVPLGYESMQRRVWWDTRN